jgi:hypothetical protein
MRKRGLLASTAVVAAGVVAASAGMTGAQMTTTTANAAAPARTRVSVTTASRARTRGQTTVVTAQSRSSQAQPAQALSTVAQSTPAQATVHHGICFAPAPYAKLAAQLSKDIQDALRGRAGRHSVTVYDRVTGADCSLSGGSHFDSASVVKAIILAALLRWHQETKTPLSSAEQYEATLMITQSDNGAATYLWDDVGMSRLQHFLDLAKMEQTELGQDGYWGLTQVTAHDEMLLLRLLTAQNSVLSNASRSYQLTLMSEVVSWQRWGTPAGAPHTVTVHVKNGWLPDDSGWHINSIGAFTSATKNYMMAVLSDDNPSEQYGIDTIEDVARLVHRDLAAAKPAAKAHLAVTVAQAGASPSPSPSPSPSSWAVVQALANPPVAP